MKTRLLILLLPLLFFITLTIVKYPKVFSCKHSAFHEGWVCDSFATENLFSTLSDQCRKEGGKEKISSRFPDTDMHFECFIPFRDAGTNCFDLGECRGDCEYPQGQWKVSEQCVVGTNPTKYEIIYSCRDSVAGICSGYKHDKCDSWVEIGIGKLTRHMPRCGS